MAVPTAMTDLSITAASNSPAGTDSITSSTGPDDYIRALAALLRREQAKGANVASATTVDLGAIADGNYVHITGTTTITGFGTVSAGIERVVVFDGILTLTHNGTSLILPGGANITTAAGDVAILRSEGSGNWRCINYMYAANLYALRGANADITSLTACTQITGMTTPLTVAQGGTGAATHTAHGALIGNGTSALTTLAPGTTRNIMRSDGTDWTSGAQVGSGTAQASTSGTSLTYSSIPAGVKRITVNFAGVSTNGASDIIVQIGDSGGLKTSGYLGSAGFSSTSNITLAENFTTGFGIYVIDATTVLHGSLVLSLVDASTNTWVAMGSFGYQTTYIGSSGGSKSLSATLDRLAITTVNGTDAFDAGLVNILYE